MERQDRKLTALVVEDEALIALDLAMMLEDQGVEVMGPVGSVPDALVALQSGYPDIALLDYNLNGHTSEELAVSMIANNVPLAIITGLARRRLPSSLNDVVVVPKPITASLLKGVLDDLLAERPSLRGQSQ